ncbi:enoyl-CoA hydratase/isomerase family protein [Parafrankia discariae]|uniref:enoyl-CoA hydratase/isomerase family protein n=1 Tax=Parafrankia discariae TaxID=365528 RepID=UPI00036C7FC9|nr:enoyl-CoA hydratase-related protein [Parafrankia discariae]
MDPTLVERGDGLVTVTFNRPEKKNALNGANWADLDRILAEVARNPADRALLLTGAGGNFCTGAELGGAGGEGPANGSGSGAQAAEIGFVNAVVPAAGLDAAVREIAGTIAAGPPVALSMTKRALAAAGTSSLAQALEVEALAQTVNVHTRDMREAFTAYAERRPPVFEGR